jgi:predicted  nucleic acid-binding Zn-ribbon protein
METREKFVQKAKDNIHAINQKIDRLQEAAEKAPKETKKKYDAQREDFQKKRQNIEYRLEELRGGSEEAWEDIKSGVDLAVEDLKTAVESAVDRLKH